MGTESEYKIQRYSKRIMFQRVLWMILWNLTIRPFPRALMSKWEIVILRFLGAKIGKNCRVYSSARILIPSYLEMEDWTTLADHTIISNSRLFKMKKYSVFSQYSAAYCGGHNIFKTDFASEAAPITLEEYSWVASHCYIGDGVTIGRGARIGGNSAVRKSIPPYAIAFGNPCKVVGFRFSPSETIKFENERFDENERLSEDLLKHNYDKYFLKRIKEIKSFLQN